MPKLAKNISLASSGSPSTASLSEVPIPKAAPSRAPPTPFGSDELRTFRASPLSAPRARRALLANIDSAAFPPRKAKEAGVFAANRAAVPAVLAPPENNAGRIAPPISVAVLTPPNSSRQVCIRSLPRISRKTRSEAPRVAPRARPATEAPR